jgi:hypothetical protein
MAGGRNMNGMGTLPLVLSLMCLISCSTGVVSTRPGLPTDTSDVIITCDASKGNRGLYNYKGDVYVHIAVITDLSATPLTWRYQKFVWGSKVPQALAKPAGENKWNYSIQNIRKFFEVPEDERILQVAIIFRSECIDSCHVLKNKDGTDIFIPVNNLDRQ